MPTTSKGGPFISSRRTDAVEAPLVVRLKGLTEIKGTVYKRVSPEWTPNRVGQICAGFHDDEHFGRPRDIKAKTIIL